MPPPQKPNAFTGSPLDRLDHRRKDPEWVSAALADPASLCTLTWRGQCLVADGQKAPSAGLLPVAKVQHLLPSGPWALLGAVPGGPALFALDLSALDTPLAGLHGVRLEDLRRVGGVLPDGDAAILAQARGLMHWRTRHRFCGVCGGACAPAQAGHVMVCAGCATHHFPRTDPAVIMLVTHAERALLGHPTRFRDRRLFTTLAGFVEPGESLEETVAREVWEEAGVRVADVRYASSQPWPFPASLMIGFTAVAATQDIVVDTSELVEARWFTRDEVRASEGFVVPPPMSIAGRLIGDWLG